MKTWVKKNKALLLVISLLAGVACPIIGIPASVASTTASVVSILIQDSESSGDSK